MTCSHLCPEDASDVGLYLQDSGLLSLSTRHSLHQLLVWREIFPTRLCHEVAAINSVFGYSEPHARWYLMVIGVVSALVTAVVDLLFVDFLFYSIVVVSVFVSVVTSHVGP